MVYNDTLPSIYTTFTLLCIVACLTCLVYKANREREREEGLLMYYVSGWQLVVDVVVIVYFRRNPKAQKRNVFQESKNT